MGRGSALRAPAYAERRDFLGFEVLAMARGYSTSGASWGARSAASAAPGLGGRLRLGCAQDSLADLLGGEVLGVGDDTGDIGQLRQHPPGPLARGRILGAQQL